MARIYNPRCAAVLSVVFDGFGGGDSDPLIVGAQDTATKSFEPLVPMKASVRLNGYHEADTWEVEFDSNKLPFSPDLVRAAAVEVYLFQAEGALDELGPYIADPANLRITGIADDCYLDLSGNGRVFRMSGRDYTGLLLDRQWDPTKRVPLGLPLDELVQGLVDEATGFAEGRGKRLTVRFLGTEGAPDVTGVEATVTHKKVTIKPPPKRKPTAASRRNAKRGKTVKASQSYWDLIYKLCLSYGYIVHVHGFDVIIRQPDALTEESVAKGVATVAYGRNLETLEVERHLGKEQVPQIRVQGYNRATRTIEEVRFPSDKEAQREKITKTDRFSSGIDVKKDSFQVIPVYEWRDHEDLLQIARTYYHSRGRSEAKVRVKTQDLKDLDGRVDLIGLQPGDAIGIVFDAFSDKEVRELDPAQRYAVLRSLGYSSQVARLVADQYEKIKQFNVPFYTKEVGLEWDVDDGLQIEVEAVNFVSVARSDVQK